MLSKTPIKIYHVLFACMLKFTRPVCTNFVHFHIYGHILLPQLTWHEQVRTERVIGCNLVAPGTRVMDLSAFDSARTYLRCASKFALQWSSLSIFISRMLGESEHPSSIYTRGALGQSDRTRSCWAACITRAPSRKLKYISANRSSQISHSHASLACPIESAYLDPRQRRKVVWKTDLVAEETTQKCVYVLFVEGKMIYYVVYTTQLWQTVWVEYKLQTCNLSSKKDNVNLMKTETIAVFKKLIAIHFDIL